MTRAPGAPPPYSLGPRVCPGPYNDSLVTRSRAARGTMNQNTSGRSIERGTRLPVAGSGPRMLPVRFTPTGGGVD
jgi:hypothetical protein